MFYVFITSSGMLEPRLLRHALDFTTIDRMLFSTDHPFAHVDAAAIGQLFDSIPDPVDRDAFAGANAAQLLRIPRGPIDVGPYEVERASYDAALSAAQSPLES